MALKLEASQVSPAGTITSDRRLFLRADEKTVVEDGDSDARFLLASAGGEIPADKVKQLGLEVSGGKVSQSVEKMAEETANSQSALKRMAGGDQEMAKEELAKIEQKALDDAKAAGTKQAEKPADKSRTATEDKARGGEHVARTGGLAGPASITGAPALRIGHATVVDAATTAKTQVAKPTGKSPTATVGKAGKGRGK